MAKTRRIATDDSLLEARGNLPEFKLTSLMAHLPGMAYRCLNDKHWTMLYVSDGCAELTGYTPDELVNNKLIAFNEIIHPDDRESIRKTYTLKGNERHQFEQLYRIITSTGILKWVWEQGEAALDDDGKIVLQGLILDITDRVEMEQDLRESQGRYQSLFEASPDAILLTDLTGAIQVCNARAAGLLDTSSADALVGKNAIDFLVPEDSLRIRSNLKLLIDEEVLLHRTYHRQREDGTQQVLDVSASVIKGTDGKAQAFTVVVRDVTEEETIRQALQVSEMRYRAIVEENPDMIIRYMPDGRVIFANEACCQYFGKSREELLGKPFDPVIPVEDQPLVREMNTALMTLNRPVTVEHRVILPSGETRWTKWTARPILDDEGDFLEYQMVGVDITEVKKADRALRDSERRWRELLENIKLIAVILDVHGEVTFCNGYFSEVTGWGREQVIGQSWFDRFLPFEVSASFKNVFLEATFSGIIPARYEHPLVTKRGERRMISWNNTLLRNNQGEVIGVASIGEDITERKWAEKVQAAIYKISQAANAADSLPELYRIIHGILSELMPVDNFFIALNDQTTDLITFPYFVDQYDPQPAPKRFGRGLTEYVFRTGKALLASPAVFKEMVARGEVESIGAPSLDWLGVPLKVETRTIGVMVTQTYIEGVRFGRREEQILSFVSSQVAMAIDRKRSEEELRTNQQRFQTLVEASTDGIFLETLDGRILDVNPSGCKMYGYTREELLRLTVADLMPVELHSTIEQAIKTELTSGGLLSESVALRKNGTTFPIEVSTRLTYLADQRLVVAFIRDITERKLAESAILESETKFRTLAETSAVGIFIHRGKEFVYVNPGWCRITGYSEEELQQMPFWKLSPPSEQDGWPEMADSRLRGENQPTRYESKIITKTGELRWLDVSVGVIDFDGSKATVGTASDITERKQNEERLVLQSTALESAANAILILDRDRRVTWANQALSWLSGYSESEVVGATLDFFDSGRQDAQFYKQLWDVVLDGRVWHGELVNRRKDGSQYTEEMTLTPVVDDKGNVISFVAIKQDITYRKQRERELETIARVSASLRTATTRTQILPLILEQLMDLLKADGSVIGMIDSITRETVLEMGMGAWRVLAGRRQPFGTGVSGYVISLGKPYINNDAHHDPYFAYPELLPEIQAIASVPLIVEGATIGALVIGAQRTYDEEDLRLMVAIGDIAASAIHRAELYERTRMQAAELTQAYDATIEGWAHALELRDKETQGHTLRVTELTLRLAEAMGFQQDDLVHIRRGVLLHDIGKMGIPDHILLKNGPLTDEEWVTMRCHPQYAFDMLSSITYLRTALDIPYCHHEKWDGSGYPRGLKGEEIPLAARIFAVVDVWDALTSDRPYRAAWKEKDVRKYIEDQSGIHFDPQIAGLFLDLLKRGLI